MVKNKENTAGKRTPVEHLIVGCKQAFRNGLTHTVVFSDPKNGDDVIMDLKIKKKEKLFEKIKEILPKGVKHFRVFDLSTDFEKMILNFHPGAKNYICEG